MALEHPFQLVVLCNLIATSFWISWGFETNSAVGRPFHLAICVFVLSGIFWFTFSRWADDRDVLVKHDNDTYSKDPRDGDAGPGQFSVANARFRQPKPTTPILLVFCLVLRVVLLRSVLRSNECSWNGVEILLPFLLSIYEVTSKDNRSQRFDTTNSSGPYYIRYAVLVGIWTLSAVCLVNLSTQYSTYICASVSVWDRSIPVFQHAGLFLDFGIIIGASKLAKNVQSSTKPRTLLGKLAFSSAGVLAIIVVIFLWIFPKESPRSIILDSRPIFDLLLAGFLSTNLIASVVYLMSSLRPPTIFVIVGCILIYVHHYRTSKITDFSPTPSISTIIVALISCVSVAGLVRMERDASRIQRHMSLNRSSSTILTGLFIILIFFFLGTNLAPYVNRNNWTEHPINLLISNAKYTSDQWRKQAAGSKSLEEAVLEYQLRYGIPPPPNFDKWYNFATSRNSLVIDDFDQIHSDLLPFWGIEPAKIREMTGYMLARQWTDVSGLRISNGTTQIGPHMPPTHRWMMEGAAAMLTEFIQWLPDMDLGFNINDEPREAIPWKAMKKLKHNAKKSRDHLNSTKVLHSFSADTLGLWDGTFMEPEPSHPDNTPVDYFLEASWASSFVEYGIIGCPPNSRGKTETRWNKKSFCSSCASSHSLGPFISNWTLSGSVCHQPDIANLHGFYLSPSAFKPTTSPFPIFSQSKIPTFSDIIYPSPWNYQGKFIHDANLDIPYSEKENTIFWRGATSEGYGIYGAWKGMQRQRFVHLTNQTSGSTVIQLLRKGHAGGYSYQSLPLSSILAATNVSVSFVGEPTRCGGTDCDIQAVNLPFGSSVDFQDHWKYKYLFDLDGAGFSGRFLPFLQSQSLIFRAAAFRQWFDERLTAWRHFVPVDGRLHDVWGMIAYFGGIGPDGTDRHDSEARKIAIDGSEWADLVLRKEDMEIYMFRLLLEWGRIVDDRRNEMGFVLNSKG